MFLDQKENKIKDFKRDILVKRSKIKTSSPTKKKIKKKIFKYGHKARRFDFYKTNNNNGQNYSGFRYRNALHNIMEFPSDAFSNFSLEMGILDIIHYEEDQKTYLKKYEIAHVEALRPIDIINQKISWKFNFGLGSTEINPEIVGAYLNIGIGPSFSFYNSIFTIYLQSFNENIGYQRDQSQYTVGSDIQWFIRKGRFTYKTNYLSLYDHNQAQYIDNKWMHSMAYQLNSKIFLKFDFSKQKKDESFSFNFSIYY